MVKINGKKRNVADLITSSKDKETVKERIIYVQPIRP